MITMVCEICGWIYDPKTGFPLSNVPAGTAWENVPTDFVCPECGAGKDSFVPES